MKKLLKVFLLLLVVFITPDVFAKDKVFVESVTLVNKSDSVTEISQPNIKDLNVNFDLSFVTVGDSAKYKIVVNNTSNKDYEISKNNSFDSSEYIKYTYEFDNTNVVKAKSKLTMYVTLKYDKTVPSNKLVNGKYVENNKMAISLSNDKITNPKTGVENTILAIIILIVGISSLLIIKKKNNNYLTIMILLLLIPVSTYAIEKIQINVNTKITIEEKYKVTYSYWDYLTEAEASTYLRALTEEEYYSGSFELLKAAPVTHYNKYYIVDGQKYTEYYVTILDGYYKPGKIISLRNVEFHFTMECENNDWVDEENNRRTCNSGVIKPKISLLNGGYWFYKTTDQNEISNMNFNGSGDVRIDSYNNDNITYYLIGAGLPNSFTMIANNINFAFSPSR